jgi:exopolyphosphatase/guanosine-5'-triphosphate,3'-diphosphate pyrophosphatase
MKKRTLLRGLSKEEKQELDSVFQVARQCNYETKHTRQVTHLALEIFDDLIDLHKLGKQERFYLLCAAILHDIGVHTEGPHGHHKAALNIILKTPLLPFNQKDRLIVGSIARYHRRALPDLKHDHYRALDPQERKIVLILASILRVADGLDYSHKSMVQHTQTTFNKTRIKILCYTKVEEAPDEIDSAEKKSNLLVQTFKRKVVIKSQYGEEFEGWS